MTAFLIAVACFTGATINFWLATESFKQFDSSDSWNRESINLGLFTVGSSAAFWALLIIGVHQASKFMG